MFSYFSKVTAHTPEKNINIPQLSNLIGTKKEWSTTEKYGTKEYKTFKLTLPSIRISGIFTKKGNDGFSKPSGLMGIDIDGLTEESERERITNILKQDKHVYAFWKSVSKLGFFVVFKIPTLGDKPVEEYKKRYVAAEDYFLTTYGIEIDKSCKDLQRNRFLSYDPDYFINNEAATFRKMGRKKKPLTPQKIGFCDDDIKTVLEQVQEGGHDLTDNSYGQRLSLFYAIADQYGESGRAYAHVIAQNASKYEHNEAETQYNAVMKNISQGGSGSVATIATVFFYAKKHGLTIQSRETAKAVIYLKNSKSANVEKGAAMTAFLKDNPDFDANSLAQIAANIEAGNDGVTGLTLDDQIVQFIKDRYAPVKNAITQNIIINNEKATDTHVHTIWHECRNFFQDEKGVTKELIESKFLHIAPVVQNDFLIFEKQHEGATGDKTIRALFDCLKLTDEKNREKFYQLFKKWYCGIAGSMLGGINVVQCVLTGAKNKGKTKFFRYLLPDDLSEYYCEEPEFRDKDGRLNWCKHLLILDDELSMYDGRIIKAFKANMTKTGYTLRLPYGRLFHHYKRYASLCGTSNEKEVINDATGKNRRILPLDVKDVDLAEFAKINKAQALAEALAIVKEDETSYYLTGEDIETLHSITQEHADNSLEFDLIGVHLLKPKEGLVTRRLTTAEILHYLEVLGGFKNRLNKKQLENELKRCGYSTIWDRRGGVSRKKWLVVTMND